MLAVLQLADALVGELAERHVLTGAVEVGAVTESRRLQRRADLESDVLQRRVDDELSLRVF